MLRLKWMLAGVLSAGLAVGVAFAAKDEGVIDPKADAQLKKMSEYLAGLKSFRVDTVGDVMAHHLAVTEKDLDWQIWIQDGAQPVPLRYVITSKDLKNHPQFTLDLRGWEPSARLSADAFMQPVPANAKQLERKAP